MYAESDQNEVFQPEAVAQGGRRKNIRLNCDRTTKFYPNPNCGMVVSIDACPIDARPMGPQENTQNSTSHQTFPVRS